jgi:catechol 2,3-dioxygenase-like lactoylglutathione lyase family enzyme
LTCGWICSLRNALYVHINRLDHVTINTTDLDATLAFYEHFLGLRPGWRPSFEIGGAWLYADGGDYPILHVITRARPFSGGMFDHVAFRSVGLDGYIAKVKASGTWYRASPVPETSLVQVLHYDPNQILIEVNFDGEPLAASEVTS